jgi:hypothetical protein
MKTWRNLVDKSLQNHLELQIREASKYKSAYRLSKNPSNAQLWCAVANLSRQIFDLSLKVKFLEKALQDLTFKPAIETPVSLKLDDLKPITKKATIKATKKKTSEKSKKKKKIKPQLL